VLVPDPVYPVYVDTNIMAGNEIIYAVGNEENGFLPMPADEKADIIYICSPNNPTGAAYNKTQLQAWVDYAISQNAVILFDSAYEAFVQDNDLPTSIFEIHGAQKCAIEIGSLSKTAGFTGTRCGYTIVPNKLKRDGMNLHRMWSRRQTTKYNQLPYIVQRGAEAAFLPEGFAQSKANVNYYLKNAELISETLNKLGIWYCGGKNAPYVWLKCPNGLKSWEFFDRLLNKINIVGTPGSGFGVQGEGFFRLSAFGSKENTKEAMERLTAHFTS
jgi:LL-diaminopimelate aminotransferase